MMIRLELSVMDLDQFKSSGGSSFLNNWIGGEGGGYGQEIYCGRCAAHSGGCRQYDGDALPEYPGGGLHKDEKDLWILCFYHQGPGSSTRRISFFRKAPLWGLSRGRG